MSEPYLGDIKMFAGNFPPRGYAFCDGQLLPINSYQALFSLLGTNYGGDGRTTFGLPDLRGRAPMHDGSGTGPGLTPRRLGEKLGQEQVTLTPANLPSHTHTAFASVRTGSSPDPSGHMPAVLASGANTYAQQASPGSAPSSNALATAGNSLPHNNMMPYTCISFIIALQGIFPSRS